MQDVQIKFFNPPLRHSHLVTRRAPLSNSDYPP